MQSVLNLVEDQDKRKIAIHEAAHLVAAVASGLRAWAWIAPVPTSDPVREHTWTGQVEVIGSSGLPAVAAVAVAGAVAQYLEDNPSAPEECPGALAAFVELDAMSPEDAAILGEGGQRLYDAIDDAVAILRANEPFVAWAVAQLMDGGFITDVMADDQCHGVVY